MDAAALVAELRRRYGPLVDVNEPDAPCSAWTNAKLALAAADALDALLGEVTA